MLDSPGLRSWNQRYPIFSFVLLAYGFTWLFWTPVGYLAESDRTTELMLMLVGGWGPALAAIALSRTGKEAESGSDRRLRLALFLGASILGLLLLVWRFTSGGKEALIRGTGAGQGSFSGLPLLSVLIATVLFAFVVSRVRAPDPGVRSLMARLVRWRVAPVYYAFALLILPMTALAGVILAALLGQSVPESAIAGHSWSVWVPAFVSSFLLTVLFTGGICEEVGWRGFLLPELQKRFSPLTASLIIAPIWTFWHLPIYLNGIRPPGSLVSFFAMIIVLSVIFTWLYNRTGGSVLLVVLLHAAVNNHGLIVPRTWYAMAPAILLVGSLVIMDRMYRRRDATSALPVGIEP